MLNLQTIRNFIFYSFYANIELSFKKRKNILDNYKKNSTKDEGNHNHISPYIDAFLTYFEIKERDKFRKRFPQIYRFIGICMEICRESVYTTSQPSNLRTSIIEDKKERKEVA